jgi:hypothetical protein
MDNDGEVASAAAFSCSMFNSVMAYFLVGLLDW